MSPDPEKTSPPRDKKTTEIKDLPAKNESEEITDKVKGGLVGPCDRKRQ